MGELCPLTFSSILSGVLSLHTMPGTVHHRHFSQSCASPFSLASLHSAPSFPANIPKLFPFCIFACLCVSLYSLSVISLGAREYMIFKVVNENKKLHFLPLLFVNTPENTKDHTGVYSRSSEYSSAQFLPFLDEFIQFTRSAKSSLKTKMTDTM